MFQTDQPTVASSLPTPSSPSTPGFFTNGNPASGVAATILDADFLNMMMMELINVVQAASITPSKTTYTQVRDAIKSLTRNTAVLTDTGTANAYAAVNPTPLVGGAGATWVDGVMQAVKIAHANTGASTYAPDGLTAIPIYGLGLQPLQGAELFVGGTAILMHVTIAGVNSGNPICVLMECAGGAQQVPAATASQHAVQFGQLVANIGDRRNLICDIATASASATFTAESVVVGTAVGGLLSLVTNLNATINIGTIGAGGMDVSGLPSTASVAVYLIKNPTTGAVALLGWNASSAVATDVYSGTAMPAGSTQSALLMVLLVQTSQFLVCYVQDRHTVINQTNQVSTSSTGSNISLSLGTPLNAKAVDMYVTFTCSTATNANIAIGAKSDGTLATTSFQVSGQTGAMYLPGFVLRTARAIWYSVSSSAGTPNTSIALTGWWI